MHQGVGSGLLAGHNLTMGAGVVNLERPSAKFGAVGRRKVEGVAGEEEHISGLHRQGQLPVGVEKGRSNDKMKGAFPLGVLNHRQAVRAGPDKHAAVLFGGFVESPPGADDLIVGSNFKIGGVLMGGFFGANAWRFDQGHVLENLDIVTQEGGHGLDDAGIAGKAEEAFIAIDLLMNATHGKQTFPGGQTFRGAILDGLLLVDDAPGVFRDKIINGLDGGLDDILVHQAASNEVALLVEAGDLFGGEGSDELGRGLIHKPALFSKAAGFTMGNPATICIFPSLMGSAEDHRAHADKLLELMTEVGRLLITQFLRDGFHCVGRFQKQALGPLHAALQEKLFGGFAGVLLHPAAEGVGGHAAERGEFRRGGFQTAGFGGIIQGGLQLLKGNVLGLKVIGAPLILTNEPENGAEERVVQSAGAGGRQRNGISQTHGHLFEKRKTLHLRKELRAEHGGQHDFFSAGGEYAEKKHRDNQPGPFALRNAILFARVTKDDVPASQFLRFPLGEHLAPATPHNQETVVGPGTFRQTPSPTAFDVAAEENLKVHPTLKLVQNSKKLTYAKGATDEKAKKHFSGPPHILRPLARRSPAGAKAGCMRLSQMPQYLSFKCKLLPPGSLTA